MKTRSIPHGKTLDMPPPLMMLHKTRAENPTLLTHKTVIKKLDVSKNRDVSPKMDGENHGKAYEQMG